MSRLAVRHHLKGERVLQRKSPPFSGLNLLLILALPCIIQGVFRFASLISRPACSPAVVVAGALARSGGRRRVARGAAALVLGAVCVWAGGRRASHVQAKPAATGTSSGTPSVVASAPSLSEIRKQVLLHLEDQVGATISRPALASGQSPVAWLEAHLPGAKAPSEEAYRFVGQTLLLSEHLFGQKDLQSQRRGLLLASQSADFVAVRLSADRQLLADIYQVWVLPHLGLAGVRPFDVPGRQRLIEASVSAFGAAGERAEQGRMLEWLLRLGARSGRNARPSSGSSIVIDANTLDWARGTLAALLMQPANAPRADLQRALHLLQGLNTSPRAGDMSGFLAMRRQLEARLRVASKPVAAKHSPVSSPSVPSVRTVPAIRPITQGASR